MITPAELFELEKLLKESFEEYCFDTIHLDTESDVVSITDLKILQLIEITFSKEQYQILNNIIHIDINLFKILQSRYFPQNPTINILSVKGKLTSYKIE